MDRLICGTALIVAKTSKEDNLKKVISSSFCGLASCAIDIDACISAVNDISSPANKEGQRLAHVDKCDMHFDRTSTCADACVDEAATSASSMLGKNNFPSCAGGELESTFRVQFS